MFPLASAVTLVLFLCVSASVKANDITACTICGDGSLVQSKDRILPNAVIGGFPLTNVQCGTVDTLLELFVPNRTAEECGFAQALGPYCGCPNATTQAQCNLCGDDGTSEPRLSDNELPFLEDMFGFIPTCALLEVFLMSVEDTDGLCLVSKELLTTYCGCNKSEETPSTPTLNMCTLCQSGEAIPSRDKELSVEDFPLQTCGDLESALSLNVEESSETCRLLRQFGSFCGCPRPSSQPGDGCVMCTNGGSLKYPNRTLSMLGDAFYGFPPTCEIMEALVRDSKADSDECKVAQFTGVYCGCDAAPDPCYPCGREDPSLRDTSYDDKVVPKVFLEAIDVEAEVNLTCKVAIEDFAPQFETETKSCNRIQQRGDICGCYGGRYQYLGARSRERKMALLWLPRMSGILSLIGASAIIAHILRTRPRRQNLYCQLMLGMSILDFFGSIAWILMAAAIPRRIDVTSPVLGRHGTDASCKIQNGLFQLSLGSIFYCASLITYFFLVIVKSKRGRSLDRQRWWLHGTPILATLVFVGAAMPSTFGTFYGCHTTKPYQLMYYPAFVVIAYCLLTMAWIILHVRRVSKRARKWRFPTTHAPSARSRQNDNRTPTTNSNPRTFPQYRGESPAFQE